MDHSGPVMVFRSLLSTLCPLGVTFVLFLGATHCRNLPQETPVSEDSHTSNLQSISDTGTNQLHRVGQSQEGPSGPTLSLGSGRLNVIPGNTVNLAKRGGPDGCGVQVALVKFMLEETQARVELKYKIANKIDELYGEIEKLKSHVDVKKDVQQSSSFHGKQVAFSAEVASHLTGLGHDDTIIFGSVQTNEGDAYSGETGVFTCPVSGLYLFSATVLSNVGDRIETELMLSKAGKYKISVAKLYSGAGSDNRYGSGSNTVILRLNVGDKVWLRVYNGLGSFVFRLWSSFSGVLLQPSSTQEQGPTT